MFFAVTTRVLLLCRQENPGDPVDCCVIADTKTNKPRGHKATFTSAEFGEQIKLGGLDIRRIAIIDDMVRQADDLDFETGGVISG
jgi:hypothetical protein